MTKKSESEEREEKLLSKHGESVSEAIIESSVPEQEEIDYYGEGVKVNTYRFDDIIGDDQHEYSVEINGKRIFLEYNCRYFAIENIERVKNSLQKIATMGQRIGVYSQKDPERSIKELVRSVDFIMRFFDEPSKARIEDTIDNDDVFDETMLYSMFMGAMMHVVSGFPLD